MVASQIQIRFGSHTSQSGDGRFSVRVRGAGSGRAELVGSISTRRKPDGDTHTRRLAGAAVGRACERQRSTVPSVRPRRGSRRSSDSSACTGCPAGARSTRAAVSRRRARQRCTRESETATTRTPGVAEPGRDLRRRRSSGRLPRRRRGPAPAPACSAPTGSSLTTDSSIACASTASVSCAISARAASSCQSRGVPGRPVLRAERGQGGVRDRAPYPDHRRYVDVPLAGGLGLADLAAVTCKKISHWSPRTASTDGDGHRDRA